MLLILRYAADAAMMASTPLRFLRRFRHYAVCLISLRYCCRRDGACGMLLRAICRHVFARCRRRYLPFDAYAMPLRAIGDAACRYALIQAAADAFAAAAFALLFRVADLRLFFDIEQNIRIHNLPHIHEYHHHIQHITMAPDMTSHEIRWRVR